MSLLRTLLPTLSNELLAAAIAATATPPDRRFVAHGAFAHDCALLAVRVTDYSVEPIPNFHAGTCDIASFSVTLLRCVDVADDHGKPPTAAAITDDAHTLLGDLGDLVRGLADAYGAGTLFPSIADLGDGPTVQWPGSRPIGPEGGIAGWEVFLTLRD